MPEEMRERRSPVATVVIVLLSLLLCLEIGRLSFAAARAESDPGLAFRLAPASPDVLASKAMAQVGQAAATGGNPAPETFAQLRRLLRSAPLRPEPLLVQAAMSERAGDYSTAERLLLTARMRDPRSLPALYLLADVWLRQGKIVAGLRQMAMLSRFMPGTSIQLVPALAEYARVPGAQEKLSEVLSGNPQLKKPLFAALSADPDNAELILALADDELSPSDPGTRAWESRLLNGLISRRDYGRAYGLWRRFSGLGSSVPALLFNGEFKTVPAPPPFNWNLSSSGAGIAEAGDGALSVLYYGRDDITLASQLLLLPPGTYRFEARVSGQVVPGSLVWSLQCAQGSALSDNPMTVPVATLTFTVPSSGCAAQWLQLQGKSADMPQQSDAEIAQAHLQRVRP
jgi:hypothetical protein